MRARLPRVPAEAVLLGAVVLVDLSLFTSVAPGLEASRGLAGLEMAGPVLPAYEVAGALMLLGRRRRPGLVVACAAAHAALGPILVGLRPTAILLVALFALASSGTLARCGTALVACVPANAAAAAAEMANSPGADDVALTITAISLFYTALQLTAVTLGRWAGRRDRAHDSEVLRLQRRAQEAAAQAVALERQRLARELHDIVAHAITVMLLASGGARKVLRTEPDRAAQALAQVQDVGTSAVEELRRLLAVLTPAELAEPDAARVAPVGTTLAGLEAVIDRTRDAGVNVLRADTGHPELLDRSVAATVVRVVQEGLTNVVRHAGPRALATVTLAWEPGSVTVAVTDDGRGTPEPGLLALSTGHGLPGLSERVALVGGHLRYGPLAAGGFELRAMLPTAALRGVDTENRAAGPLAASWA